MRMRASLASDTNRGIVSICLCTTQHVLTATDIRSAHVSTSCNLHCVPRPRLATHHIALPRPAQSSVAPFLHRPPRPLYAKVEWGVCRRKSLLLSMGRCDAAADCRGKPTYNVKITMDTIEPMGSASSRSSYRTA